MRLLDQVLFKADSLRPLLAAQQYAQAENAACGIIKNIFAESPTLGLDLDGTIDENPMFFSMLSKVWPGDVIIVTCRDDMAKAEADVQRYGIDYCRIVLAKRLDDKAAIIKELGIDVYIDDQDECLSNIDPKVTVLKIRNGGNSEDGRWLYSRQTGQLVE